MAGTEKAIFSAGCFWGVEHAFREIRGVIRTAAGYTGGTMKNPSYEDVCTGRTGHAEAVLVEFDPSKVSYKKLLDVFWSVHDPTQINRQGPDVGNQYRSAIFFFSKEQKDAAIRSMEARQEKYKKPITTWIAPSTEFYVAEDYHQQYYEKRGIKTCG